MWQWLSPQLDPADAQALASTLAKARGDALAAEAYATAVPAGANAAVAAQPVAAPANAAAARAEATADAAARNGAVPDATRPAQQQRSTQDATEMGAVARANAQSAQPRAYELRDLAEPTQSPAERAMRLLALLAALRPGP